MKNPHAKILIIDDEAQIRKFLRVTLEASEYTVCEADCGQRGIDISTLEKPDLILLDLGLPDMSGADVLRTVRSWSHVPIIVVSVRDAVEDIVAVLDNGANDYIIKPFNTPELIARIRAALRQVISSQGRSPILHFKHVTVDLAQRTVYVNDERLKLTRKEYEIVRLLASNGGKVVTQGQMLNEIWGPVYQENVEYLRTYIGQLRKKLEIDYKNPEIILTETGIGYRFREATKH